MASRRPAEREKAATRRTRRISDINEASPGERHGRRPRRPNHDRRRGARITDRRRAIAATPTKDSEVGNTRHVRPGRADAGGNVTSAPNLFGRGVKQKQRARRRANAGGPKQQPRGSVDHCTVSGILSLPFTRKEAYMPTLNQYQREMQEIAKEAGRDKGVIGGGAVAWLMMVIGVIVTGTMTYSLTHKGMRSNALWKGWVDFAALLPVALLEGSALALVYGRHHWFRSEEQRKVANTASWVIWVLLGATSVTHFAFGNVRDRTMEWLMGVYASYILPLAIVAVPMLWKKLYDSAPESAMRVAVLEAEASMRSQLIEIHRQQNDLLLDSYREALDTPRVAAARRALLEQASVEHARTISGLIQGAEDQGQPDHGQAASPGARHSPPDHAYAENGVSASRHPY